MAKIYNISTTKIGKLAKRHHATILYGIRTAMDRMSVDKEYKKKYDVFVNSIGKDISETYNSKFK